MTNIFYYVLHILSYVSFLGYRMIVISIYIELVTCIAQLLDS